LLAGLSAALVANPRLAASFSAGSLDDWQQRSFDGNTRYSLVGDDGTTVLNAVSDGSASALGRRIRIDLKQTPWVSWRWKIGNRLEGLDERSKEGDDFAARVYLVVDGGLLKWRTRTVTYVWSSSNPAGTSWRNAHNPRHAAIIAVRGQQDEPGVWQAERRNAYEDFKAAFGREVHYIDAVVVMTDTDNSGQRAEAWYGDIGFSER
jgi:hypothetical protein